MRKHLFFMVYRLFRGLILVALIAASMSTFDSGLNSCLGYCVRDLYQRYLRPQASNRELIRASYVSGVLVVVSAYLLAYSSSSLNDIWEWVVMGLGGGMIVPVMLRFYWWRFNGGGFAIGSLVGMFGALALRFIQVTYFPDMDSRLQFCILLVLGLVASIVGTYVTRPTDEKVLAHFYKTTRPFGFWPSRFKELLSPEQRRMMQREHRCDLSAVPFVFLFQVTLYLMPMQLLIRQFRAFGVTLAIFTVGLIGMYVLWYRELPPAQSVEEPEGGAGGIRP